MAGKKPQKDIQPGRRVARFVLRCLTALVLALLLWMAGEGSTVQLSAATLPLSSLPAAFDGTRVLYLSDLHINSLNSVNKVNALIEELAGLEPDLLLLGGDYTSFDPFLRLTRQSPEEVYAIETEMRDLFFLKLAEISPPLGKFGVAGEEDNLLARNANSSLADAMALGNVTLLKDQAVRISKQGDSLVIVGVDDWRTGMQDTRTPASQVSSSDCVLLLCHNPECIPSLINQPASDEGKWIDAAFSGHTHGGTISLGRWELFNPLGKDERYKSGWHMENGAKVLISRGVGGGLLPLRLNASPQAHIITLTRKNG